MMPVSACTCCGETPCIVSLTCPTTNTYTVGCPVSITWGSCTNPVTSCGSPVASLTATRTATCQWLDLTGAQCIGGWIGQNSVGTIVSDCIIKTTLIGGCYYYEVDFIFPTTPGGGTFGTVAYVKRVTSSTDSPIGTYSLLSITAFGGASCSGASADATITVSP